MANRPLSRINSRTMNAIIATDYRGCSVGGYVLPVCLDALGDLADGVGTELLEQSVGQHYGGHRQHHDRGGGNCGGVAALAGGIDGLLRDDIDRGQRLHERGDRLHRAAYDQLVTVGDAALEAAGAVRFAVVALVTSVEGVVDARAGGEGGVPAVADLCPLERLYRHHGLGEAAVELAVPLGV